MWQLESSALVAVPWGLGELGAVAFRLSGFQSPLVRIF